MRTVDLAREHGLSTQAVRNYEALGILPPASRSETGYRDYTRVHAAALSAFLALNAAHGFSAGRGIMQSLNQGRLDEALDCIDDGHALLARDRTTLRTVESALAQIDAAPTMEPVSAVASMTVGELARHLKLNPATLRAWERAGILAPGRDSPTGHRRYHAADVRDAELAHLLRRGGHPLATIATVVREVREVGSLAALGDALEDWRRELTSRGTAMLNAAARLSGYLGAVDEESNGGSSGQPHLVDAKRVVHTSEKTW